MSDKIEQKVQGNNNNILGKNGDIKVIRSPVKVPIFYEFQNTCVDSIDVSSEIEYYLKNGWELIGSEPINGVVRRREKILYSPVKLRFRRTISS
ncbi:hypothetical protein [Avibacterium paragallinarum]|uniref:DUF1737 domain-containing protein n=1 Tax=Avibacterium paragallinarum TaxID=728 RepID=A0A377I4E7_AVIPA|nr:hypothetical protein [Avibacterium paragallinarum]POY46801.1 hypothetical protein C3364_05585 [Avibacterium paragallinarum]RZN74767.1 hypothetical protein EC523_11005 [Avibacterium paragallinarum]STO70147.1 Uncharacterised protein [Avibacterium paragallinarum]